MQASGPGNARNAAAAWGARRLRAWGRGLLTPAQRRVLDIRRRPAQAGPGGR